MSSQGVFYQDRILTPADDQVFFKPLTDVANLDRGQYFIQQSRQAEANDAYCIDKDIFGVVEIPGDRLIGTYGPRQPERPGTPGGGLVMVFCR